MVQLRKAELRDHEFLVRIDLKNDGYTTTDSVGEMGALERKEHSDKIMRFLTTPGWGAYICEDTVTKRNVGMIMYSEENCNREYPWKTVYRELDRGLFPEDGRLLAVFQLWVHPDYRRRGLATQLKQAMEEAAKECGVRALYTHTEETNAHVVELNRKLGYVEARRGPIWDDIVRVSLVKQLG